MQAIVFYMLEKLVTLSANQLEMSMIEGMIEPFNTGIFTSHNKNMHIKHLYLYK